VDLIPADKSLILTKAINYLLFENIILIPLGFKKTELELVKTKKSKK